MIYLPLRRLLYVSTLTPKAAARLGSTVEDILLASSWRNIRDGVTGFLLCDGDRFAQVLEGPPAAVEACYSRIARDDRHGTLLLRAANQVDARRFGRWSMCGLTLSAIDDEALRPRDIELDLDRATPAAILDFLTWLADRHGPRLDALHDQVIARQ